MVFLKRQAYVIGPGLTFPAGSFPGDAVPGAIVNRLMDVFIGVVCQGQDIHKTGIVDLKGMGGKINTDLAEDAAGQINVRCFHGAGALVLFMG